MNPVTLPLFDEFMEIFEKCEILNWEAKHFWGKIKSNAPSKTLEDRNKMYKGLSILVNIGYLEVNKNDSSTKLHRYIETKLLKELRSDLKNKKLVSCFSKKKTELLFLIDIKKDNINFLNSLCRENKELEYILNDYILEIEFEIGKTELNIKLMESIEKRQKIKTIN